MKRKSKLILPYAPVNSLLKKNSNQRISTGAVEALTEELIKRGKQISERAYDIAQHSGRKTVLDKDITLAYEQKSY